jgi:anthranilate phosphoribosyltransferase
MKDLLNYLFENNTLTKTQARETLKGIAGGKYNTSQVAAFLAVYRMRSITLDELEGFRDAMLDLCIRLDFDSYNPVDLCGTGGDNKDTFNISTLASFIVAGAGVKVAKHGNYGVSSLCGSSNVLEHLGIKFTADENLLKKHLDTAGICILHAPLFHPAMKMVAPIRKELGFKTFFNILGPMVNPSFPKNQLVGVFSLELARLYAYIYQKTTKNYIITHSLDGYDEVSLTASFKVIAPDRDYVMDPADLQLPKVLAKDISGGASIEESAKIFLKILQLEGTETQQNVVLANAALALHTTMPKSTLDVCLEMAKESLFSKKAFHSFQRLLAA